MRKLRLTKVVQPEIVAEIKYDGQPFYEWRCPECGFGVAEDYLFCPYCGSELDTSGLDEKSERFLKILRDTEFTKLRELRNRFRD